MSVNFMAAVIIHSDFGAQINDDLSSSFLPVCSLISLAGERGRLGEMKSLLPTETHFLGDMCRWVEQPWMPLKES